MSEAIAGFKSPAPSEPLDAAVAVVIRFTSSEVEVLWVRREVRLSFGGGFYAFPGGRTESEDARIEVLGANGPGATLRATGIRELFEETGLLLARGQSTLSSQARDEMRRALLNHGSSFEELLQQRGLTLSAGELHEAGRWITPEFLPRRFDARFFLLEAPEGAEVEQWPESTARSVGFGRWKRWP